MSTPSHDAQTGSTATSDRVMPIAYPLVTPRPCSPSRHGSFPPPSSSPASSSCDTLRDPSPSRSSVVEFTGHDFSDSTATTPAPSRPLSFIGSCEYDGPTRVGSPEPFVEGGDKEKGTRKDQEFDVEEAGQLEKGVEEQGPVVVDEYPEGGTRAYLALAGSTLVLTCTFSISNSFGTFLNYYKGHQLAAYDTSKISWIGSSHLFITFGSAFLAGILFDKGYFRYQLAFGCVFWIIGLSCLSISRTFIEIFLCQSLCMGIALGAMFSPCLSVLGTYFRRRRAFVVGVAASGTAVGAVCFPIMLEHLFARVGFKMAILYLAILQAVVLVVANFITKPRPISPSASSTSTRTRPNPNLGEILVRIARQPSAWLVCLGVFFCMITLFIPLFYVVTYARDVAHNDLLADYALAIINATAFFARIGAGLVADRIGVFNTALPLAVLLGVMTFALLGATTTGPLVVFLILFGVAQGGFISCSASTFMSLAEDMSELGLRGGIGFFFIALASLIGSPVAGALLKRTGTYTAALGFGGACAFVGCALLFLARQTQVRRKSTRWV
ncbi:hypothetical protein JCM10212_001293 [Sporobolomyces blumeae]